MKLNYTIELHEDVDWIIERWEDEQGRVWINWITNEWSWLTEEIQ